MDQSPFHYSIATRARVPYVLKLLAPRPGERILDVGCGVGYFSSLMTAQGADVFGVDIDRSAAVIAARHGSRVSLARAESLPFADNSFDKLVCSEVLEHILEDDRALAELRRVAKPGAVAFVTVPSPEGLFGAKIKGLCHGGGEGDAGEKHERDGYARDQFIALMKRGGFIVDYSAYTLVLFAELLMGATKLAFAVRSGQSHLRSQSQVDELKSGVLLRMYRLVFPAFLAVTRIEDRVLGPWLKGHMLVVRAVIAK